MQLECKVRKSGVSPAAHGSAAVDPSGALPSNLQTTDPVLDVGRTVAVATIEVCQTSAAKLRCSELIPRDSLEMSHCTCQTWCADCSLPKCRPHQTMSWAQGTLNSTYAGDYPEKKAIVGSKTDLPGKQFIDTSGNHLGDATTQRTDYSPKGSKYKVSKPKIDVMPSNLFDASTTYQQFHDAKAGSPATPGKKSYDDYSGAFDGTTSYGADYVASGGKPSHAQSPKHAVLTLPFEGVSSYSADFSPKSPVPTDARAKPPVLNSSMLANNTTYATDYEQKSPMKTTSTYCCKHSHQASQRLTS